MGDGLQLSLRAPRENAAHGSYWAFATGAASSRAICSSFRRCRGVKYRALQYYRTFGVSRCSCDIKPGPSKAHAHDPRGVVTTNLRKNPIRNLTREWHIQWYFVLGTSRIIEAYHYRNCESYRSSQACASSESERQGGTGSDGKRSCCHRSVALHTSLCIRPTSDYLL
jgi:hypothetical protein